MEVAVSGESRLPSGWYKTWSSEWSSYYYYSDSGEVLWNAPKADAEEELPSTPRLASVCSRDEENRSLYVASARTAGKRGLNKIPFRWSRERFRRPPCSLEGGQLDCLDSSASACSSSSTHRASIPRLPAQRSRPHLLLHSEPGRRELRLQGGTVAIMGPHCSGTKVLAKYMRTFFDMSVQPPEKTKRVGDGTVRIGSRSLWKHTVPLADWELPARDAEGANVTVLLTVREPMSWVLSLSQHPYEVARADGGRRRQGDVRWMADRIRLETTDASLFCDPFAGREFESAVHLWQAYASGYLHGSMTSDCGDAAQPTFVLVKYEDVLHRPIEVLQALADAGLPRRLARPLAAIDEGVGTQATRDDLRSRSCLDMSERVAAAGGSDIQALIHALCSSELRSLG
eukprot:TRINITY_DN48740_c0_g1_i1.p1 TRINITY_DN48740_c0_g1~~TRINITY_DN48740_c0_g1_i1.p1  ORF type:complete len:400 (+),score=90.52 TRINITY_DN48740_c0_g1_i1:47-1246(+)